MSVNRFCADRFQVLSNPAHEKERLVLGLKRGAVNVRERHWKLEAVFRAVNKLALAEVDETGALVFDDLGEVHNGRGLMLGVLRKIEFESGIFTTVVCPTCAAR
jgi:hypothetical protein